MSRLIILTVAAFCYICPVASGEAILGFLYPDKQVTLCAKVTGQIVQFPFKVGDRLKKGQVVARIDDTIAKLRVKNYRIIYESRAELESIDVQISQTNSDIRRQIAIAGAKVKVEQFENQLKILQIRRKNQLERIAQNKINLEVAEKNLADHTITANVSGVIVKKFREEGESAELPQPVVTIAVTDRLVARIDIPANDIPRVRKGMELSVKILIGKQPFVKGKVRLVGPMIDTASALIPVDIEIQNKDNKLIPGCRIEVVLPK